MRRLLPVAAAVAGLAVLALPVRADHGFHDAEPDTPFTQDPIGPLVDVTVDWQEHQPAECFYVRPDVFEFSGDDEARTRDPESEPEECLNPGFDLATEETYRVEIETPPLCPGCRRLFLDYSAIPPENDPPDYYARGHAYFSFRSWNVTYTADPRSHSPNVKNVRNDEFFVPPGAPWEPFAHGFDLYAMSYAADPANTAHTEAMGPYYVGPWYVNRDGAKVFGAYLDVDAVSAEDLRNPRLNEIRYGAAFNSGEATCPDNVLFGGEFADGNYGYGGCIDRFGGSGHGVNPQATPTEGSP